MNTLQTLKKQLEALRKEKQPIIVQLQSRIDSQQQLIKKLTQKLLQYQQKVHLNKLSALHNSSLVINITDQANHPRKYILLDVTALTDQDIFITNVQAKFIRSQQVQAVLGSILHGKNSGSTVDFVESSKKIQNQVLGLQDIVKQLRGEMNQLKKKYQDNAHNIVANNVGYLNGRITGKKQSLSQPQILQQQSFGSTQKDINNEKLGRIKQQKPSIDISIAEVSSQLIKQDSLSDRMLNTYPTNINKKHSQSHTYKSQDKINKTDHNTKIMQQQKQSQEDRASHKNSPQSSKNVTNQSPINIVDLGDSSSLSNNNQYQQLKSKQNIKIGVETGSGGSMGHIKMNNNQKNKSGSQAKDKSSKDQLKLTTYIGMNDINKYQKRQKAPLRKFIDYQEPIEKVIEGQLQKIDEESQRNQSSQQNLSNIIIPSQKDNNEQIEFDKRSSNPDKTQKITSEVRFNSNKTNQDRNSKNSGQNQRKSQDNQKKQQLNTQRIQSQKLKVAEQNKEKRVNQLKPIQIKTQNINDKSSQVLTPQLTNKATKTSQQQLSIQKDLKRQKRENPNSFENYPQATIKISNKDQNDVKKEVKSNALISQKAIQQENESKKDSDQKIEKKDQGSKQQKQDDLRSAQKLPSKQLIDNSDKGKQLSSEWKPLSINQNSSLQLSFPKSPAQTPVQQLKKGIHVESAQSLNQVFNKQESSSIGEVSSPSSQSINKNTTKTQKQNNQSQKPSIVKPLSLDSQTPKPQPTPIINQSLSMQQSTSSPTMQNQAQKQASIFRSNISKIQQISSQNNSGASQHPSIKEIHSMLTINKNNQINKIDEKNVVSQDKKQQNDANNNNNYQKESQVQINQRKQDGASAKNTNQVKEVDKNSLDVSGQQKSIQKSKQAIPIKLIRDSGNSKEASVKSSSLEISPIKFKQSIQESINKQSADSRQNQQANSLTLKQNKDTIITNEKGKDEIKAISQRNQQQKVKLKQQNINNQSAKNEKTVTIQKNNELNQELNDDSSKNIQTKTSNTQQNIPTQKKPVQSQIKSEQQIFQQQKQTQNQTIQQKLQPIQQKQEQAKPQFQTPTQKMISAQTQLKQSTPAKIEQRKETQAQKQQTKVPAQSQNKLQVQQKQKQRKSKASNQKDQKAKATSIKSPKNKDDKLNWGSLFSAFPSDKKKDTKSNKESKQKTEQKPSQPKQTELNTKQKQQNENKQTKQKQVNTPLKVNEQIKIEDQTAKVRNKLQQKQKDSQASISQNNIDNINNVQNKVQKIQSIPEKINEANLPASTVTSVVQNVDQQSKHAETIQKQINKVDQQTIPVKQSVDSNQTTIAKQKDITQTVTSQQIKNNKSIPKIVTDGKQEPTITKMEQVIKKQNKIQDQPTQINKQQIKHEKQQINRESASKITETKQIKEQVKKPLKNETEKPKQPKTQTKDHHDKEKHKKQAEPLPNWTSLFPTFSTTKKPQHKQADKKHQTTETKVQPEVKKQSQNQQLKELKNKNNQILSKKQEILQNVQNKPTQNKVQTKAQDIKTAQVQTKQQQLKSQSKQEPVVSQFDVPQVSPTLNEQRQSKKVPPPIKNIPTTTVNREDSPQFNFQVKSPSIIISKPQSLTDSVNLQKKSNFKQAKKQSIISSQKSLQQIDDEYQRVKKLTKQAEIKQQQELDKLIEELNQQETKQRQATRKKQRQQQQQKRIQNEKAQQAQAANEKPVQPQQNIDSQIKQLFMFGGGGGRSSSKKQRESKHVKSKEKQPVQETMTKSGRRIIEPAKPTQFMIKQGSGEQLKKSQIQALQENVPVTPTDDNVFDNFLVISGEYSDQSDKQKRAQSPTPVQLSQATHRLKYTFSYEPEQSQSMAKFEKKTSSEDMQQISKHSSNLAAHSKNLQLKIPSVIGALVQGTLLNESSTPYPVEKARKKSSDLSQLKRPSQQKSQDKDNTVSKAEQKKDNPTNTLTLQIPMLDKNRQSKQSAKKTDENVKISDVQSIEINKQQQIAKSKSDQPSSTQLDKQSVRKQEDVKKVKSKVLHFRKD